MLCFERKARPQSESVNGLFSLPCPRPKAPVLPRNHWKAASHETVEHFQLAQCYVCFAFFTQWNRTINKPWLQYEPKFQQKQYYPWIWTEGHKLSKHSPTLRKLAIWKVLLLFWNSSFLVFSIIFFLLLFSNSTWRAFCSWIFTIFRLLNSYIFQWHCASWLRHD